MDIQKTILTPFNRSLGNGAAMGQLFLAAVEHVIAERDTTVIVKLINAAKAKKDSQAETGVRTTFAAIFNGAKTVKTKNGFAIQIKDATINNDNVSILKDLVSDGVSMRGTKWLKSFKATEDVTLELDYIKKATLLVKDGYDAATLFNAMQAASKDIAKKSA